MDVALAPTPPPLVPRLPTPRDMEDRSSFEARCLRAGCADKANTLWTVAKARSLVSIKNGDGEWLLFD